MPFVPHCIGLRVQQSVEVVGGRAVDHLLQRLREERAGVRDPADRRILPEQLRLGRVIDVRFECEDTLASGENEQLVLELQQLEVVLAFGDVLLRRHLGCVHEAPSHLAGRRCDQRADCGPDDDDELGRLDEDGEVTARHREAATDRAQDQEDADECHASHDSTARSPT